MLRVAARMYGSRPFGDESSPAWPGLDRPFLAKHAEGFLCGGAADLVLAGEMVEAWYPVTGLELAAFDPGAEVRRHRKVRRQLITRA